MKRVFLDTNILLDIIEERLDVMSLLPEIKIVISHKMAKYPLCRQSPSWKFWHCVPCFAVGTNLVGSKLPPSSCHHQNIFWRIPKLSRSKNTDSFGILKTRYSSCRMVHGRIVTQPVLKRSDCFCFRSDWILEGWMVWLWAFVWELVHKQKAAGIASETQSQTERCWIRKEAE